jgi:hypothetical protein
MSNFTSALRPFSGAISITPNDNSSIAPTVGLYVGGAGNVTVRMRDNVTPVTFFAVPAGTTLNISVIGVNGTGTTSANLLALY